MEEKHLINYYSNYDEDGRLERKHQRIEFLTTVKYIEKYLEPNSRILEVGAGTGRYSLYFASKGYKVDALELVEHNIDILNSKVLPDYDIEVNQGNALDLSQYKDNTFDVTLVLGPMYHMYTVEDKNKVIEEALRVTKAGGYLMIAYITHDAVIVNWGLQGGNFLKGIEKNMFTDDYKCISKPEDVFAMLHVDEFNELASNHKVTHVHTVGTDGIAPWFRELFAEMSDELFDEWLKYHYATCERKDLIGHSNHILYIGKKD